MAIERSGSLRRPPLGADRRLTGGRLLTALIGLFLLFAIVLPGATLISLELDRRSLVIERVMREAELYLLNVEIETLAAPPSPTASP